MSDDDRGSSAKDQDDGQTCRDFLRNVCDRGARCKFKHPESAVKVETNEILQDKMMFCHDFQNGRCSRSNCKFIHCPKDVESHYLSSGYMPPLVREQVIRKAVAVDFPAVVGGVPACKDYLQGRCDRGAHCRFRHLSPRDYDIEMYSMQNRPGGAMGGGIPPLLGPGAGPGMQMRASMDRKRRHMDGGAGDAPANPQQAFIMLQEENGHLRQRVMELEKKVSDLTATNEFLLDQNAQLRLGAQRPSGPMYGGHM